MFLEKVQMASYRDMVEGHCAQQSCAPPGLASPVSNSCALQEVSDAVIITEWSPVESCWIGGALLCGSQFPGLCKNFCIPLGPDFLIKWGTTIVPTALPWESQGVLNPQHSAWHKRGEQMLAAHTIWIWAAPPPHSYIKGLLPIW